MSDPLHNPLHDPLRPGLTLPAGRERVLLHSCCAPCSGEVMEAMLASGIRYDIFFTTPTFILSKSTKSANKKTSASLRSTAWVSLMPITMLIIGLNVSKA